MSEKRKKATGKSKVSRKGYTSTGKMKRNISIPPVSPEDISDANLYKSGIWGLDLTAIKLPPKANKEPNNSSPVEIHPTLTHSKSQIARKEETFKTLVKSYKKADKTVEKAKKSWKKAKKNELKTEEKMMAKLRLQIAKSEKRAFKEEMERILENA